MNLAVTEDKTGRALNLKRKMLRCLGCGKEIYTDRCHRFCQKCKRRNKPMQDKGGRCALHPLSHQEV